MEDLIGNVYYRFELDKNEECVLSTFTLTALSPDRLGYEFAEDSDQLYINKGNIEKSIFLEVLDAAEDIYNYYNKQIQAGENPSTYINKIYNSKIFQEMITKYPSIKL